MFHVRTRLLTAATLAAALIAGPVPANAAQPEPGPALQTAESSLQGALTCSQDLTTYKGTKPPLLLVHGQWTNGAQSFELALKPGFLAEGYPVCIIQFPYQSLIDVQILAEYVVYAVRKMYRESGRKISIVGHSQGPIQALWALKFWPDLPAKVDDFVSLTAPHQGTLLYNTLCARGECNSAQWQLRQGSKLMAALNRGPLPVGPSYTTIATALDPIWITPAPAASVLAGASNLVVQSLCPAFPTDHIFVLADNVSWSYIKDALENPGPAVFSRVPPSTCLKYFSPGFDLVKGAAGLIGFYAISTPTGLVENVTSPVASEPPLREYVPAV